MTKVTTIFLVLFVAAFEWSMVKSATTTKTPSMTTTTMMPSMTTTPKPLAINTNTGPKCGSVDDCKVLSPFYRSCVSLIHCWYKTNCHNFMQKAAPVAGNCDVRGECFGGDFDTNETLECGSGKKCVSNNIYLNNWYKFDTCTIPQAFLNTDESSFCISKYSTHKSVQQDNAARMAAPQGSTQPPPVAPFENKRKNPSCKSVNDCLSKSEFYKSCVCINRVLWYIWYNICYSSTRPEKETVTLLECVHLQEWCPLIVERDSSAWVIGFVNCSLCQLVNLIRSFVLQVFINKRLNLCLSAFITRQALSTVPKQLSQAATN